MNSTALHTRRNESTCQKLLNKLHDKEKTEKVLNKLHQKQQIVANAKNSKNSTNRNESKRYELLR